MKTPTPMYDLPAGLVMTEKGLSCGPYSAFRSQGWTDAQLIDHGYAIACQSHGTEPVAWMTPSDWRAEPVATCDKSVANAWRNDNRKVMPLYAAPVEKEVTQQAAKAETAEQKPEHGSLADNLRIEQTDPGRWVVCVENWFPDEDSARAACRKWKAAYFAATLVNVMVDRFLGWKLPEDFYPDAGISFDRAYAEKWGMPSGTNLFHAGQAKAMFEHVLAAPTTSTVSAPDELEQAARLCEEMYESGEGGAGTREAAKRIRALRTNPATPASKGEA